MGADDAEDISPPSQPSPVEGEGALVPSPLPSPWGRVGMLLQSVSGKPYLIRCLAASIRWQTLTPGVSPRMVSARKAAMS